MSGHQVLHSGGSKLCAISFLKHELLLYCVVCRLKKTYPNFAQLQTGQVHLAENVAMQLWLPYVQ